MHLVKTKIKKLSLSFFLLLTRGPDGGPDGGSGLAPSFLSTEQSQCTIFPWIWVVKETMWPAGSRRKGRQNFFLQFTHSTGSERVILRSGI